MPRKLKPAPTLNMTPMVDLFLLIVLFLILTTSMASPQGGLPVNLPAVATAQAPAPNTPKVGLSKEGKILWQKNAIEDTQLVPLLKSALDSSGMVVLQADKSVAHGRVVKVMELIKQAGAKRVAIAVETP